MHSDAAERITAAILGELTAFVSTWLAVRTWRATKTSIYKAFVCPEGDLNPHAR
jgi:hypothetical protein